MAKSKVLVEDSRLVKRRMNKHGIKAAFHSGPLCQSKFSPEFVRIAYFACKEFGADNIQLAKLFEVDVRTIERWMRGVNACEDATLGLMLEEFKKAVIQGKDDYDSAVIEKALKTRATGYEYEETRTERVKLTGKKPDGTEVSIPAKKVIKTIKHIPADATSIIFWLTNRQRDRWKRLKTQRVEGTVDHRHKMIEQFKNETTGLKVEDIERIRQLIAGNNSNTDSESRAN